jgi:hypothetical protein
VYGCIRGGRKSPGLTKARIKAQHTALMQCFEVAF